MILKQINRSPASILQVKKDPLCFMTDGIDIVFNRKNAYLLFQVTVFLWEERKTTYYTWVFTYRGASENLAMNINHRKLQVNMNYSI